MIKPGFSPLEERVLELLCEQWHTSEEIQRELWPEHAPVYVTRAIAYLRENELIQVLERPHGQPYLDVLPLGEQLLADVRRSRRPMPCG